MWAPSVALLVLWVTVAHGHVGDRIYPVYQFPQGALPDLHDATAEDWEDAVFEASLTHDDFADVGIGPGVDPSDLAHRIFLGWSEEEQRIYFAVERFDDRYINEWDGIEFAGLTEQDGIRVHVDGDHSGGEYFAFTTDSYSLDQIRLMSDFQAQSYAAVAESPTGRSILTIGSSATWVSVPPWSDAGGFHVGESPDYSLIEGYVTPWDALDWRGPDGSVRSQLFPGKIIGLQFTIPDFDEEPGRYEAFQTVGGQNYSCCSASYFVDAILLCGSGECLSEPASAVRPDSWARIKASFR